MRLPLVIWFSLGAVGLGLVALEAARRKVKVSATWYVLSVLLGPIFLFFILPLWLGRWGRSGR